MNIRLYSLHSKTPVTGKLAQIQTNPSADRFQYHTRDTGTIVLEAIRAGVGAETTGKHAFGSELHFYLINNPPDTLQRL